MKRVYFIALASLSFLSPRLTRADAPKVEPIQGNFDVGTAIGSIINIVLGIVGGLAVLFIIIGGVRYIISAGNPDQAGAAKKTILYAVIGLLVVIFSYVIVNVIAGIGKGFGS